MMEPTDWMDAAVGSTELFRLEPKWLRVTYTFAIEMMETTEWMKAAKDSSVLDNRNLFFLDRLQPHRQCVFGHFAHL